MSDVTKSSPSSSKTVKFKFETSGLLYEALTRKERLINHQLRNTVTQRNLNRNSIDAIRCEMQSRKL